MKGHLFAAAVVASLLVLASEPAAGEVSVTGAAPTVSIDHPVLTVTLANGSVRDLPIAGGSIEDVASMIPNNAPRESGPGQFNVNVLLDGAPQSAIDLKNSICTPGIKIPQFDIRTRQAMDRIVKSSAWTFRGVHINSCQSDASSHATNIQFHYDSVATGNSEPQPTNSAPEQKPTTDRSATGAPVPSVEATVTLPDGTVHKFTILRLGGIDIGSPPPQQGPGVVNFDVPSNQVADDPTICASGMYGLLFNGIRPSDALFAMAAPLQLMGAHAESCRPASSPNVTNIQVRYSSAVTLPPANPAAPSEKSRTTDRLRRGEEFALEFGVPFEFLNVETGIFGSVTTPGGSTGGSTIPGTTTIPFSSKFRINNDHAAWRFGLDWRKPIDSSSDIGLSFGLDVPLVGTNFKNLNVAVGTCPTCLLPGTQSFAPRLGGSIFVNWERQVDFGCEQPPRLFLGAGFGVNNYRFGTDFPALNLNVTTEHTDVVPGFQGGVSVPVPVGTTWFDLGLTAGYFLPGSNDRLQVGNTVINSKVGGTAFVEASMSWELSEEWVAREFHRR